MIVIPEVRRKPNYNIWKFIALLLLVIIIMASLFLSAYWYVFGTRNFFKEGFSSSQSVYTAPQYRLGGIMKAKFFNLK